MLDRQEQQLSQPTVNPRAVIVVLCLATGENMKISILGEKWIGRRGKGVYCLNVMSYHFFS
jgi:hypothetical protein